MFGRKSKPTPEETPEGNGAAEAAPAEEKPAPKPAPASSGSDGKKVNLAAKKALLKAYYRSSGFSEEQIQEELARIAGEEGEAATIPGAPPPPAAGSIEDLESQVREIGKLAGDTILKMEEQISGLLAGGGGGGDSARLDNLQEQINTIYENQQTAYQSLTELTGNVGTLTEQLGDLRVKAESMSGAAPAQDSGLEERLTAMTEGLAKRISALEDAPPPEAAPSQDSGLEERMTAITGGMGERISAMEQMMLELQTKLDEVASKEPAPAEGGAADGELAQKLEELAAKMAAGSEVIEKMQEKVDDLRRKEGKTLAEIERHVADQLRVTMEDFKENMERIKSETFAPQIKEELDRKINILEEFQEGTLPALDEVKSSAENIKAALITALDECLGELDGGQAAGQ